jgi:hypothetical protein
LNKRDKAISDSLGRFRVLDRNQIICMHFSDQKQPITTANRVLQRLVLKGELKADISRRPYFYMRAENKMKFDGSKVPHFKSIADFYIELCKHGKPSVFEVEIKVTEKGGIEPDVFMIWKGTPFFVEIQRSLYTSKVMQDKIDKYQAYYESGEWKKLTNKFPLIWIQTETDYLNIQSELQILQSKNIEECIKKYMQKK